jgi:hypothetical protein
LPRETGSNLHWIKCKSARLEVGLPLNQPRNWNWSIWYSLEPGDHRRGRHWGCLLLPRRLPFILGRSRIASRLISEQYLADGTCHWDYWAGSGSEEKEEKGLGGGVILSLTSNSPSLAFKRYHRAEPAPFSISIFPSFHCMFSFFTTVLCTPCRARIHSSLAFQKCSRYGSFSYSR